MIVISLVVFVSVLVGRAANHFIRPRVISDDEQGPTPSDLISPIVTLTVLFLAFVLVQSSGSYSRARAAVGEEVDVVQHLFQVAEYAPQPQQERLQAAMVCYTRAVDRQEWAMMATGDSSPVPDVWNVEVHRSLQELAAERSPLFATLLGADHDRDKARSQRLVESNPTIPEAVYVLVVVLLATALIGLGFMLPRVRCRPQRFLLVILAVLLSATIIVIRDLDEPFAGLTGLPSTAVSDSAAELSSRFTARYGSDKLPCTEAGMPA